MVQTLMLHDNDLNKINKKVNEMLKDGKKYVDLNISSTPVTESSDITYTAVFVYEEFQTSGMTWHLFTDALIHANLVGSTSVDIIYTLFEIAKCNEMHMLHHNRQDVIGWINNDHMCIGIEYFPTGCIDAKGVFDYFRTQCCWKLVKFRDYIKDRVGENSIINVDCNSNMDTLCYSIVDQLLDLMNLPFSYSKEKINEKFRHVLEYY